MGIDNIPVIKRPFSFMHRHLDLFDIVMLIQETGRFVGDGNGSWGIYVPLALVATNLDRGRVFVHLERRFRFPFNEKTDRIIASLDSFSMIQFFCDYLKYAEKREGKTHADARRSKKDG